MLGRRIGLLALALRLSKTHIHISSCFGDSAMLQLMNLAIILC